MKLSDLSRAAEDRLGKVEKATDSETTEGIADKWPDAQTIANNYEPRATRNMVWDSVSDTFSRDGVATGTTPIHEGMRRCVLTDAGEIAYFLDPNDSTLKEDGTAANLDGTDGQVMVRVPKFWVRVSKLFNGEWKREISEVPRSGFVLHPAFAIGGELQLDPNVGMWHYKGHTGERDAFFVGAYTASVYDSSAGTHIDGLNLDDNDSRLDYATDLLASVSGYYPMVGVTLAGFRDLATNRGTGWQQWDLWQWSALKLLFFVEYAGFNSQQLLNDGNVSVSPGHTTSSSDQTDSPHSVAGKSNSIGNGSGGVDSTTRDTAWVSYRGIEHLWGNTWQFIDGAKVNERNWYVNNDPLTYSSAASATDYDQLGVTAPTSNGYIRDVQHETLVDIVRDSSGNSSTAFADYYYQRPGWRPVLVGGYSSYGALAGVSAVLAHSDLAIRARGRSGRVAFKI